MRNFNEYSIQILEPFLKFCSFLSIVPPHTVGNEIEKQNILFIIYSTFVALSITLGYSYSVYGKIKYLWSEYIKTVLIIDIVASTLLTAVNLLLIFLPVMKHGNHYKVCLNKILVIDSNIHPDVPNIRRHYWKIILFCEFCFILLISLDSYVWMAAVHWKWYQYYLIRNLQIFHAGNGLVLVFLFITSLKIRFETVNNLLIKTVEEIQQNRNNFQDLKNIRKCHICLCDAVDGINRTFGIILLGSVLFVIAFTINFLVIFIVHALEQKHVGGIRLGFSFLLLTGFWCTSVLVGVISLARACDELSVEAVRTAKISYSLLNDVPTIPKCESDQVLKEELFVLAQQVICHSPAIKASGFFAVNYTMLGFIIASITSYIIVIIQFISIET